MTVHAFTILGTGVYGPSPAFNPTVNTVFSVNVGLSAHATGGSLVGQAQLVRSFDSGSTWVAVSPALSQASQVPNLIINPVSFDWTESVGAIYGIAFISSAPVGTAVSIPCSFAQ